MGATPLMMRSGRLAANSFIPRLLATVGARNGGPPCGEAQSPFRRVRQHDRTTITQASWHTRRSFGVRKLAAASARASLLAGNSVPDRNFRGPARGEESGSKLPHSKAPHHAHKLCRPRRRLAISLPSRGNKQPPLLVFPSKQKAKVCQDQQSRSTCFAEGKQVQGERKMPRDGCTGFARRQEWSCGKTLMITMMVKHSLNDPAHHGANDFTRRSAGARRLCIVLLVAPLFLADQPLRSQQATEAQAPPITQHVIVVNVLATVRDKKGAIVRDLTQNDFELKEDDRPQTVRYFSHETDLPLTLGLLVDTSLSQRRVLGEECDASATFLDQVLRVDKDQAFVIHFDREVELLQDLTSSREKLERSLALLQTPERSAGGSPGPGHGSHGRGGGGTLLYDAVYLASNEVMKTQQG